MAFVISRLVSKRLLAAQHSSLKIYNVNSMSAATVPWHPCLRKEGETHDDKNTRLNRPMSPYMTIYKFGLSGALSITHRITGCALSVYAMALAGAAFCPADFNTICTSIEAVNPGSLTILIAKFLIAFPFTYHTCNGVRHLVWDTGRQLTKKGVFTTGTIVLGATIASTLIVTFL